MKNILALRLCDEFSQVQPRSIVALLSTSDVMLYIFLGAARDYHMVVNSERNPEITNGIRILVILDLFSLIYPKVAPS